MCALGVGVLVDPPLSGAEARAPLTSGEMAETRGGVTVTDISYNGNASGAGIDNLRATVNFNNDIWQTSSVWIRVDANSALMQWQNVTGLTPPNYSGTFDGYTNWPYPGTSTLNVLAFNQGDGNWYWSGSLTDVQVSPNVRIHQVRFWNMDASGWWTGSVPSNVTSPTVDLLTTGGQRPSNAPSPDVVLVQCPFWQSNGRSQWRNVGLSNMPVSFFCPQIVGGTNNCSEGLSQTCRNEIGQHIMANDSLENMQVVFVSSIGGSSGCPSSIGGFHTEMQFMDAQQQPQSVRIVFIEENQVMSGTTLVQRRHLLTNWLLHELGHNHLESHIAMGGHTLADGTVCCDPNTIDCSDILGPECTTCPFNPNSGEIWDMNINVMCRNVGGRALYTGSNQGFQLNQCQIAKNSDAYNNFNQ